MLRRLKYLLIDLGLGIFIAPTSGFVGGENTQQVLVNFTTSLYKFATQFECSIIADATPMAKSVFPLYMNLVSGNLLIIFSNYCNSVIEYYTLL